jgi:uncharacterized protein (DUF433 family)
MVWVVIGSLAGGSTKEEVADDYGLAVEDIDAALAFAADVMETMNVTALPVA